MWLFYAALTKVPTAQGNSKHSCSVYALLMSYFDRHLVYLLHHSVCGSIGLLTKPYKSVSFKETSKALTNKNIEVQNTLTLNIFSW